MRRALDWRLALAALAAAAVILYGSLYPFAFAARAGASDPIAALLATWGRFGSRGDLILNVLLYMPPGFFAAQALWGVSPPMRLLLVGIAGFGLSVSIELMQVYLPGRSPALSDVLTNSAGTLAGALGGLLLRREGWLARIGGIDWRPFPLLLIACWLGYRLFPYLPVIDLSKYWAAVKPLLVAPELAMTDLFRHAAIWLALAALLESLLGQARGRIALLLFVPAVLGLRILIAGIALSPAEVAGAALALAAWWAALSRIRFGIAAVALLFAAMVVLQGLEPFRFQAEARAFGWLPFRSFLHGSTEANIRSFLEKAFTYGALVWLLARAGLPLLAAALAGGALVMAVRLAQMWLPGRSAEITDVIVLLAMAGLMKPLGDPPRRC